MHDHGGRKNQRTEGVVQQDWRVVRVTHRGSRLGLFCFFTTVLHPFKLQSLICFLHYVQAHNFG